MSPGYGMFQQQTAKMRMTPQFRQAIKLLQLPTPDLLECIRQELQENLMLEPSGTDWDAYAEYDKRQLGQPAEHGSGPAGPYNPDYDPLHQAVWKDASLEKHLKEQLNVLTGIPRAVRQIIAYMTGNLDEKGYMELSLAEIADALQADYGEAEQALDILQGFEPAGVGARDLQECLIIQANRLPACPPLVPVLIRHHLEDIAYHSIHRLAAKLQASSGEMEEAIGTLKQLNPRPGAAFAAGDIPYIVPDVRVEQAGERFVVTVQNAAAPRLSINGHYERLLKEGGEHDEAKAFLYKKLNAAAFFIKCIEQRRDTLFRVTQAIVEEQIDFFREGISRLKPMNLKRIADRVSLHESTVSRVTAGKYAQTPWGVFELKAFFPSGYRQDSGDSASAGSVKARIKELIGGENRKKPYSDQQLADRMTKEGIRISRRTVAKYREEMGISSSVNRKRL